jgi:hypothetical protein
MISVKIPKLANLQKALKKYPEYAGKEIKNALEASLWQIVRETKPITPVDSGFLKGSIGDVAKEGLFEVKKLSALVGTKIKYAVYVHEGFQKHTTGQRKFLEVGLKKATPMIKQFFAQAVENTNRAVINKSK